MAVISGHKARVLIAGATAGQPLALRAFRWSASVVVQEYDITCAGAGVPGAHRYTTGLEQATIELDLYYNDEDNLFFPNNPTQTIRAGSHWNGLLIYPDKSNLSDCWYWSTGLWTTVEAGQTVREASTLRVRGLAECKTIMVGDNLPDFLLF